MDLLFDKERSKEKYAEECKNRHRSNMKKLERNFKKIKTDSISRSEKMMTYEIRDLPINGKWFIIDFFFLSLTKDFLRGKNVAKFTYPTIFACICFSSFRIAFCFFDNLFS